MSDDTLRVGVEFDSTGSEDRLAATLQSSLKRSFDRLGPQLAKDLAKDFTSVFKGADIGDAFRGIRADASRLDDQFKALADRLDALIKSSTAARGSFGDTFDARNLDAFESSLDQIIRLQEEVAKGGGDPELLSQLRSLGTLAKSELTATRTQFQQTTLAARESAQNITRDQRQESRERIAAIQAEKARFVTETQAASSRELALIRAGSNEQVAITKATAQQRAAAYELVGRAVRSTERVIRSTFEGTARIVGGAFNGIAKVASNAGQRISQTFRSSNRSIANNYSTTNSAITSSYRRSFRKNTDIVNSELNQQESRVKEFAREASEEISTIGLGRVAGFAALGVVAGRALRGGFERAATLEDSERGLTALLGSAEEAVALREEILNVVTGTPFKLDQFAQAGAQLVAFNIEAEKVPTILTAIADAAAIRGGDAGQTIDSLVRVFGQISASGRLTGEDLNQLSEAGVPALQILGNAFGELGGDMRDLISDGAVPADRAIQVLTDGIINGSDGVNGATAAFGGLAKELGTTLRGSVGNFSAALDRLGATIITKFQPLLVGLVRTATEFVDVLASAFASLGEAIIASPVYRVLSRFFINLGASIETAGEKIKPVLDFLAEGLVAFGTAAGAVAGIRRIPLLFNAIAFAVRRVLTPFNLLIAAGVVVGGFISRLIDSSPELSEALTALGRSFGRIARVVGDLVSDVFNALAVALDNFVTPAVGFLSEKIVEFAVPALEALNEFIVDKVLPAVRRFARFIRSTVVPAISNFLTNAVEIATEAFGALADFVREKVIPVVGPILERAVEIGQAAFESAYNFLSNTFLPFIESNLVPVLAGLGAALGTLAFTGGNLPLAGLIGVGAGLGAALANDETRATITEFFRDVVDDIKGFFSNLIDDGVLQSVAVGALKVAERIGRVIGSALSDRRTITAVAGIAAAAAALAGAFVVGFGRGVIQNIPELTQLLRDAFTVVFDEVWSDPQLFAGLVAAIASASLVAKLVRSARATGRVMGTAISQGAVTAGGFGAGGGASGFITGLFGGPNAVRTAAARTGQDIGQQLVRGIQNQIRVVQNLGGQLPSEPLGLQRTAGEPFADYNKRLARTFQDVSTEVGRLEGNLGKAAVSGIRFRDGLRQIGSGEVRRGLQQVGTAIKDSGREIATAAGAVAGGLFMASFVSEALFSLEASGTDRLQSAIGLAASAIGTGAVIGGAPGAAAGAAVAGFGLLTSALKRNEEGARRAKQRIQEYADAIREASKEELPDLFKDLSAKTVLDKLDDDTEDVLRRVGFRFDEFGEAIANGSAIEAFGDFSEDFDRLQSKVAASSFAKGFDLAGDPFGLAELEALDLDPLIEDLIKAGATGEQVESIYGALGTLIRDFGVASETAARQNALLGEASPEVAALASKVKEGVTQLRLGREASETFRTKLQEINGVQIDEAKRQVDEAKGALDNARGAADDARQALIDFLTGNTEALSLEQATNQGIVNIASLGESIETSLANAAGRAGNVVAAEIALKVQEAKDEAGRILAAGDYTSAEDARAGLQPIIDAAPAVGTEAGDKIRAGIEEVIAGFQSEEGQSLLSDLFDAEAAVSEAQSTLDAEESYLNFRTRLDPETVPNLVAEAEAAAQEVQESFSASLTSTENMQKSKTAGRTVGSGAGEAAGSPSAVSSWRSAGRDVVAGFAGGITSGAFQAEAAARVAAQRAIDAARAQLKIESPSKAAAELGEFFSEGLAEGITEAAPKALVAAATVANRLLRRVSESGRNAIKEIGRGLAEEGGAFVDSVRGVLDDALKASLSKAQQFRAVGQEIAAGLFAQQGLRPGQQALGGFGATQAVLDRLDQGFEANRARENFTRLRDEFGNAARTFARTGPLGRANRAEFLTRGLDLREFIQGQIEAGVDVNEAVKLGKQFRDALVREAINAGATTTDINDLLNTLGLTNNQLGDFIREVNAATSAVRATTKAEEERIAAEKKAEEQANAPTVLQQPIFRDLVLQTPTRDPEAVALYVANRVALSARR